MELKSGKNNTWKITYLNLSNTFRLQNFQKARVLGSDGFREMRESFRRSLNTLFSKPTLPNFKLIKYLT